MLMDTDLERGIGLGVNYPFPALQKGECVISVEEKKVLSLNNGTDITIRISMVTMLNDIIDNFNTHVDNVTYFPVEDLDRYTYTNTACKVVGFMETSYQKYPEFSAQVIMEYSGFTDYLADNLPSPLSNDTNFIAFMKG